jgi:hypothetical protein
MVQPPRARRRETTATPTTTAARTPGPPVEL